MLMKTVMDKIGVAYIVQMVTDNIVNFKKVNDT